MKTSVVIPSYNPALKLPETLHLLAEQYESIDELILVIDHTNFQNLSKPLVEKYSAIFNLKIVEQKDSGRGKSRNKGAEVCSGDLIIFFDDDMLPEKDLIKKHIQYHIQKPGIILSGNGYRNPEDAKYDFGKYLVKMEDGWKKAVNGIGEITFEKFNFTACNMSLPKNIFEQLGGFDTRFSDGEDFDFAVRAIDKKIRVVYDNTLLAWHNDWPEISTYIKRQAEYRKAKKEIFKAHPEYLAHFAQMLPKEKGWSTRFLDFLLKSPLTWFVTSQNSIFAALPCNMRFRLYELAIAVNTRD